MKLFDVYPLFDINIVKGKGCHVWDDQGTEYLDLYGGHAVISIGHAHPYYVEMISNQVAQLGFYSNSVVNKLQQEVADRLGKLSGYDDYQLFLINSGAEANENALKLASFYNGRKRVLSFCKAFHGRTSLAVEVTHNPKIIAPMKKECDEVIASVVQKLINKIPDFAAELNQKALELLDFVPNGKVRYPGYNADLFGDNVQVETKEEAEDRVYKFITEEASSKLLLEYAKSIKGN